MLTRINHATGTSGQVLYLYLKHGLTGELWNGSAWAAAGSAAYSAFALTMTEIVDSGSAGFGDYYYDAATALAAAGSGGAKPTSVDVVIRLRAGGTASPGDLVISQSSHTIAAPPTQQQIRDALRLAADGDSPAIATGSIEYKVDQLPTQAGVRDAMRLSPSGGAPAVGSASIDKMLGDLATAVAEIPGGGGGGDSCLCGAEITAAADAVIAEVMASEVRIKTKIESVSIQPRSAPPAGGVGSGAVGRKIHVTQDGNPVGNATVWITSDIGGEAIIAGSVLTDSNGRTPVMYFDVDQVIYVWAVHSVIEIDNPRKIVWA